AALDCLTRAMVAMTEGQFRDIEFQDARRTSIEEYLEMSAGKTAALMEATTRLGGLIATDRRRPVDSLARFGRALGMAFQARDDPSLSPEPCEALRGIAQEFLGRSG